MDDRLTLEATYLFLNKPPVFSFNSLKDLKNSIKNLQELWNLSENNINSLSIKEKDKEKLIFKLETSDINEYKDKITGLKEKITLLEDKNYPRKLLNLKSPPIMLFCQGNIDLLNIPRIVAMVGTRKASGYGKSLVEEFIADIAPLKIPIITGTAPGIDSTVIQYALEHRLNVISVLASGINNVSPIKSIELLNKIVENNGCYFTEFPPDTSSFRSNYPIRAKLIAAIASEFILIEVPESSGALLVAQEAFNFGKHIFCPTSFYNDKNFLGGHSLIELNIASFVKNFADINNYYRSESL